MRSIHTAAHTHTLPCCAQVESTVGANLRRLAPPDRVALLTKLHKAALASSTKPALNRSGKGARVRQKKKKKNAAFRLLGSVRDGSTRLMHVLPRQRSSATMTQ